MTRLTAKERNNFFENKLYLDKLFLASNSLVKITDFLLTQKIISNLALENFILFFEEKVEDGYFDVPKEKGVLTIFQDIKYNPRRQKQTELKKIKKVLEKIIEKDHHLSSIFLEKINIIIQYNKKDK
ncbi:MAG: hypothetical protein ACTSXL_03535 [Alphaproteobacteria bacterium]